MAEDFSCWQRFGGNLAAKSRVTEEPDAANIGWGSSVDETGQSAAHVDEHGWRWFNDPRLECLGFRGIFPSHETREFFLSQFCL